MKASNAKRAAYLLSIREDLAEELKHVEDEDMLPVGDIGGARYMHADTHFELCISSGDGEVWTLISELDPQVLRIGLRAMASAIDHELKEFGIEFDDDPEIPGHRG